REMTPFSPSCEQVALEAAELVEGRLDLLAPEERAAVALLVASRLARSATYYAVQSDAGAPRLRLFDIAGDLDTMALQVGTCRAA
ncbi:MAG: hypothetical protein AAF264_01225, partial [Pseudomonadota bacterium]